MLLNSNSPQFFSFSVSFIYILCLIRCITIRYAFNKEPCKAALAKKIKNKKAAATALSFLFFGVQALTLSVSDTNLPMQQL